MNLLKVGVCAALWGSVLAASTNIRRREGESCLTHDGARGHCRLPEGCEFTGSLAEDQPPICSFNKDQPVLCCPDTIYDRIHPEAIRIKQYCMTAESDCTKRRDEKLANEITRHVVGGKEAGPRTHVHMALIGFEQGVEKEWGCGGSLINSRFVLSAAHCANPPVLGVARWARLGDLDISSESDDAMIQERDIVQRVIHPDYKEAEVYNDIALFKLDKDVEFTPWVGPACLYTQKSILATSAVVAGWGREEFTGPKSMKLLEADLDIFRDEECRKIFPFKNTRAPRGIDSNLMICAGKIEGGKDACSGDSGGPLVLNETSQCLKTQIGVVAFGDQCGLSDSPGVYTKVYPYLAWIEDMAFSAEALDGLYFT